MSFKSEIFLSYQKKKYLNVLFSSLVHPSRRTNSDGEEQAQGGDAVRQQLGPQRPVVVRRFHFAIQVDLALLLKLAFAVVLFGQDGSRQRTMVLILLATLVYL